MRNNIIPTVSTVGLYPVNGCESVYVCVCVFHAVAQKPFGGSFSYLA